MANYAGRSMSYVGSRAGISSYRVGSSLGSSAPRSKLFRGKLCVLYTLGEDVALRHYLKRARDLGSSPVVFTEWVSSDKSSAPPTSPPVGPWGEIKILGDW